MADLLDDDEIYLEENVDVDETNNEKEKKKTTKKKISEIRRKIGTFDDLINIFRVHYKKTKSEYELEEILSQFSSKLSVDSPSNLSISLEKYLDEIVSKKFWAKNIDIPSAPVVMIVAQSALRCIELGKIVKNSSSSTFLTFYYLFAKHKKLADEIEHFRQEKSRMNLIIGTPKRIDDLIQSGSINLKRLKFIFIDWNYENVKKQRLIDLNQLKCELCSLLCEKSSLLKRFSKEKTRLALF